MGGKRLRSWGFVERDASLAFVAAGQGRSRPLRRDKVVEEDPLVAAEMKESTCSLQHKPVGQSLPSGWLERNGSSACLHTRSGLRIVLGLEQLGRVVC